jgi:aldehyde dehydrogenase (NAD+)
MSDVIIDPSIIFTPSTSVIRYEPLGVALIMGSWNYPYFVVLKPLISCIAAGNCAIIKPSEMSPNSSRMIQKLVETYLDSRCFKVI